MKGNTKSKSSKSKEEDYDDDFEDYDEDFEEEEPVKVQPAAVPKAPIKETSSSKSAKSSKTSAPTSQKPNNIPNSDSSTLSDRDIDQLRKSMEIENSEALVRKQAKSSQKKSNEPKINEKPITNSSQPKQSTTKRPKKFSSFSLNMTGSMSIDPRGRRLVKLFQSGVLDLQEEKINQLNIAPTSTYDLYLRMLRSQNSTIKQVGVPNDEESRDVEMNTDEILTANKEVQFCYGDDTTLLNMMKSITERREMKTNIKNDEINQISLINSMKLQTNEKVIQTNEDKDRATSSRLISFLQKSSQLCEALLEEENHRNNENHKNVDDKLPSNSNKRFQLFGKDHSWQVLGDDAACGANELIRRRPVSAIAFSPLQPQLLMTAHPADPNDEDDLRPLKGLHCVWDITSTAGPVYVLESAGSPTCCSFSSSHTYIAVAGCSEGSITLWDLRESTSVHKDRDSADLGIDKGIRKASYATRLSLNLQHELDIDQHSFGIIQVQPLGAVSLHSDLLAVSQFVSLDLGGMATLWVTSEGSFNSGLTDFGLSPWAKVSLVQTRVLRLDSGPPPGLADRTAAAGANRNDRVAPSKKATGLSSSYAASTTFRSLQNSAVLAAVPNDPSTILVSAPKGQICKLVRFGATNSSPLDVLERASSSTDELVVNLDDSKRDSSTAARTIDRTSFFSHVTAIAVREKLDVPTPISTTSKAEDKEDEGKEQPEHSSASSASSASASSAGSCLVLVGRMDGSVDLFQMDQTAPLQSWTLNQFDDLDPCPAAKSDQRDSSSTAPVISIKWCAKRKSAFFATDTFGRIYFFDLLLNPHAATAMERLPHGKLSGAVVDISVPRTGSKSMYIAIAPSKSNELCNIHVRRFSAELLNGDRVVAGLDASCSVVNLKHFADPAAQEDLLLYNSMSSWVGRTALSLQRTAVYTTTQTK